MTKTQLGSRLEPLWTRCLIARERAHKVGSCMNVGVHSWFWHQVKSSSGLRACDHTFAHDVRAITGRICEDER